MTEEVHRSGDATEPFQSDTLDQQELFVDYGKLLYTLRRGIRTIALVTIGASVLAVAISFLITPEYISTASFLPPGSSSNSGAAALAGQLSQIPGLGAGSLLGG